MSKAFEKYRQTLKVSTRSEIGKDAFNEPIYSWTEHIVSDILVKPNMSYDEPNSAVRQNGHTTDFKLYIPIACDLNFENAQVEIYGEKYNVVGHPKPYPAVPDRQNIWNRVVKVERTHG